MFDKYKDLFVGQYKGPFVINESNGNWKTVKKYLHDDLIKKHLDGEFWICVRGRWYPKFYYIDFDFSDRETHRALNRIGRVIALLQLKEGQYYLMTSPKYFKNRSNCHLIFKLEYNEKTQSLNFGLNFLHAVLRHEMLNPEYDKRLEIYPQQNRCFRLPFGRDQNIFSFEKERILFELTWEQSTNLCEKIRPLEIRKYLEENGSIRQFFYKINTTPTNVISDKVYEEGKNLLETGLQTAKSRNGSQWEVVKYLTYTKKLNAEKTKEIVIDWLKNNNNGLSTEVNLNKWFQIEEEIGRQVKRILKGPNLEESPKIPFAITKSDLHLSIKIFPGDLINQTRLVKFLSYCRPRRKHKWISIPLQMCCKFAGKNYYKHFLESLEKTGLIDMDWRYWYNPNNKGESFCRRVKLCIELSGDKNIIIAKKPVNLYAAWLKITNNVVEECARQTGILKRRFDEYLKRNKKLK